MIIDTHCHYNLTPLLENWQQHWAEAQSKGVTKSIVVGTTIESSKLAIQIADSEQNLYAAVGIHPNYIANEKIDELEKLLETNKSQLKTKIIALGETGLDYFRLDKQAPEFQTIRQQQINSLQRHLALASQYDLPLILHVRDTDLSQEPTQNNAYWDTLNLVKEHLTSNQVQVIMHCFSGPASYIKKMVELGSYVGVAGNITYPSSAPLREILKSVPTNKILLETDAPYLPPKQYRGKQCQPWMIAETAQFLKDELQIYLEQIYQNTQRLFPQL